MRRVLHHAVVDRRVELHRLLLPPPAALVELFKRHAKLLGHEVVDDGVDGAVGVDAHAAEEQEPGVVVRRVEEGVHHHQGPVRHPEQGEEDHHHRQHLRDLMQRKDRDVILRQQVC